MIDHTLLFFLARGLYPSSSLYLDSCHDDDTEVSWTSCVERREQSFVFEGESLRQVVAGGVVVWSFFNVRCEAPHGAVVDEVSMLLSALWIVLGLVLLVGGGEALVRGASGIALLARISPAVIGLTIVAAGTSMPELVVSLQSAFNGNPGLAVGNVVGSNIFNIGAILGLTALIRPLKIQGNVVRLEWPVMMLAVFQFYLLSRDLIIDRVEGAFLFGAMVVFTAYSVWIGKRDATTEEQEGFSEVALATTGRGGGLAFVRHGLMVLLGVGLLAGGSTALVHGSVEVARGMGVSDAIIGLTIVAAGTSTPELVTSIVAAWRGRDDIAVANVLGSNIFNALGIGGVTAMVHPLSVPAEIISRDSLWMLGFALLLFPLMKTGMRVSRLEGAIVFGGFMLYMGALLVPLL